MDQFGGRALCMNGTQQTPAGALMTDGHWAYIPVAGQGPAYGLDDRPGFYLTPSAGTFQSPRVSASIIASEAVYCDIYGEQI
jgi:hypothetical protein